MKKSQCLRLLNLFSYLFIFVISAHLSSCSFFIERFHRQDPLSNRNIDSFDEHNKKQIASCFKKKILSEDEFYATHLVVKVNSTGMMKVESYYPKLREFDYQCLKTLTENYQLIGPEDFNSTRRIKIVQYK